jgi:hypothetical protein
MIPPRYRYPGTRSQILVASVFMMLFAFDAAATSVKMDAIPFFRLEEGWNSNVYNTTANEVSSFGTRVTPGLALKFTTADNVMFQLSGSYDKVWYYDPAANAAETGTFYFRLDSSGDVKFTPKLSMLPSVYYINTSDAYRRNQLMPSGDPLLPPVSYTNYGDTKTEEFGVGVALKYMVTQKIIIGLTGNYGEQKFSDTAPGSLLRNSTTTGGRASVSYIFSPRTTAGIGFGESRQTYDNNPDSNIRSVGILLDHQFSPEVRLNGIFGVSEVRVDSAPGIPAQSATSPSGLVNVSYTSGTFTANVYGSALYGGLGGYGQPTRQWTCGLVVNEQFASQWSWNLGGTYQVTQNVFGANVQDDTSTFGTAGLRYQPWVWGTLDLTGNINHLATGGQLGIPYTTYTGILGFTISKPYNIF